MPELFDPTAAPGAADPEASVLSSGAVEQRRVAPTVTSVPRVREALPWVPLVLAIALLVLVSASLFLAARLFALAEGELDSFIANNSLDLKLRKQWLVQLCAAVGLPVLISGALLARFRSDGARWLISAADRLCPLMIACFVPSLLDHRQWYDHPLPYLMQLLAAVLLLERLCERSFRPPSQKPLPVPVPVPESEPSSPDARMVVDDLERTSPDALIRQDDLERTSPDALMREDDFDRTSPDGSTRAEDLAHTSPAARVPTPAPPERRSASSALGRYLPLAIVTLAAIGYAVHASYYTILRHHLLGTAGFDLGIFDNLMVNAMHGRPFRSTVAIPNGSYLSNHAEYGMFLFVPLYALRPGADTLLVLQSTFMGLGAVTLYLFASTQLSRAAAAVVACAYLFYAPMHGANYYDFHWMPLSMFFFFWMFYAIATRRLLWVALLTVVTCAMREDAAFGVIATGLFLIVTGHWPRLGAVLTVVSAAWFVLVKFVIMPWAGPWWFADIYKELVPTGEHGYGSVIKTILINPNYFIKTLLNEVKFSYALHLLAPLGFLAVRSPALGLLMLPGFIVTLMTTDYAPTTSISFQYTTNWVPFLFAATVIALALRGARKGLIAQWASIAAMCFGVLCHSYVFGSFFQHNTFIGGFSRVIFEITPDQRARYADLRALAALIPERASVAATELEIPHVSTRLDAYTLKVTHGEAEYLFLNREHLDEGAKSQVRGAFHKAAYGLVAQKGKFYLFRKGHRSPETDAALKTLGLHRLRETPRHRESGSVVGPGGNCIAVDLENSANVFVRDCQRDPKQRWQLSIADGRLRYQPDSQRCLGMPTRKNGDLLKVIPCTDSASAWSFEDVAIHGYSEMCLDLLGGRTNPGAEIGVWDCLDNPNQAWTITEVGEIRWNGERRKKCLAVLRADDGAPVTLQRCDGSDSQRFSFSGNRIRHAGKCLDLRPEDDRGGPRAPALPGGGWRAQLWTCDAGQWNQEFHFSGPIRQGRKCVDSRWHQTSDGSPVGTWECVGNTNQIWDMHF